MRTRHLFVAMAVFVASAFGFAALAPDKDEPDGNPQANVAATVAPVPSASTEAAVFDVSHLIRPEKDYIGTAINGAPRDMSRVEVYAERTGNKPNLITIYESFDDRFAASEVRKVYEYGGLAIVRWEPFKQKLSDIADGRYDDYLTEFATDVRTLNLPIALTVAHEMNGHWYSWGTQKNEPEDFVAAWKHIHKIFEKAGATNVIWTWTPNVINYLRDAKLKDYWPGDEYVDWVGVDGYFTYKGDTTFESLFRPTLREVGKITDKPVMIVETGSEPGAMRARAVKELFAKVAEDDNIIGFVYFNARGSANWVINADEKALEAFRKHPDRDRFGFTVK